MADLPVTPDGDILVWPSEGGGIGQNVHLGLATDARANLRRLGMAARLDEAEWIEFAVRFRDRLDMDLGGQGADDHP